MVIPDLSDPMVAEYYQIPVLGMVQEFLRLVYYLLLACRVSHALWLAYDKIIQSTS